MPAYMVTVSDIIDDDAYAEYQKATAYMVDKYGIKVRTMTERFDTLIGEVPGARIGILEFRDMETLKAWYYSDDYQNAIRSAGADIKFMTCVEAAE